MENVEKMFDRIEGSGLSEDIMKQASVPRGSNIGLDENDKKAVRAKIAAIEAEQERRNKEPNRFVDQDQGESR